MSFDILSLSETLPKMLFIEASAGTGKTFVIEHYIARLLLEGEMRIDSLALVTFTRAVARELKSRLQRTLETISEKLYLGEESFSYVQPFLQKDAYERKKIASLLDAAYEQIDYATITTIHGLCDTLLRMYGKAIGKTDVFTYIGEEEQRLYIKEFLQRYEKFSPHEWKAIAKRFRYSEENFLSFLVEGIEEDLLPIVDTKEQFEKAKESLSLIDVAAFLLRLSENFCNTKKKDGSIKKEVFRFCTDFGAAVSHGTQNLTAFFGQDFFTYFGKKRARSVDVSEEEEKIFSVCRDEIWPYIKAQIDPEILLQKLQYDLQQVFLRYLQKTGKMTPHHAVKKVLSLLEDKIFLDVARKKFSCVIIDEFQDTDAAQWKILKTIFQSDSSRLLCVGDPKQAIYSFRKADVYNYLRVKEAFPQESVRTLCVNYRATPQVVEAQNMLFCNAQQSWLFYMPKLERHVEVVHSSPGGFYDVLAPHHRKSIHTVIFRGMLGRKRKWPHDELETKKIIPWICDEIIDLVKQGALFHEIAILVKDRYQAKKVFTALQERNIVAKTWKIDSVLESTAISFLYFALLLADCPEDIGRIPPMLLSLSPKLFGPLCKSCAEYDLSCLAQIISSWKSVQETFLQEGIGGFARALYSCALDGERTLIEIAGLFQEDGDFLTDLEHILELLYGIQGSLSLKGYAEKVKSLRELYAENPGALTRRVDPSKSGVIIVTMHASKGLEFPYVFALGAASRTPVEEQENLAEKDAEKIRLLYVSITRAKIRCYLPILLEEGEKIPSFGQASSLELLAAACFQADSVVKSWHETLYSQSPLKTLTHFYQTWSDTIPSVFSYSLGEEEVKNLCLEKQIVDNASFRSCAIIPYAIPMQKSFSSMVQKKNSYAMPLRREGISGALFGTLFHEAIAVCLGQDDYKNISLMAVEQLLQKNSRFSVVPKTLVYKALTTKIPVGGELVRIIDLPPHAFRFETRFHDLCDDETFENGVLDLLVLYENTAVIIDWKTNLFEGPCRDYFFENQYHLQAQIYCKAVQRAFPQKFVQALFIFVERLDSDGVIVYP